MKIVQLPKPLLFLLFLGMRKTLLFFSLSLSFSQQQFLLVSKFASLEKSTHLVIFFIFNAIVVVILFGSSKPSHGDSDSFSLIPFEYEGEKTNYEDYDYDYEYNGRLICIEYEEEKAKVEENDFLPLLVYVGLGENKGNGKYYDDKDNYFPPCLALELDEKKRKDEEENDFLPRLEYVEYDEKKRNDECCADNDIEFVPRLVYVELKAKNVDDESFDDIKNGDGYYGYDGYDEDNDDDGGDDIESEDEENNDLRRRIEEFIAKNNKRWKEEK